MIESKLFLSRQIHSKSLKFNIQYRLTEDNPIHLDLLVQTVWYKSNIVY